MARPVGSVRAKVIWLREANTVLGVQCTEHGPRKGTETGTWVQSQRQTRLHNPRIPYASTDHKKAEGMYISTVREADTAAQHQETAH